MSRATAALGIHEDAPRPDVPLPVIDWARMGHGTPTAADAKYGGPAAALPKADIVVLTWGALVQRSILAAQQAEKDGLRVAVFDLRTMIPYDWDGIAELVKKTNRVIIAHEDQLTCGFGAEIAARISDELFEHLDAPIKRVAAMDCPVAYCPDLEEVILPQSGDVLQAIREISKY